MSEQKKALLLNFGPRVVILQAGMLLSPALLNCSTTTLRVDMDAEYSTLATNNCLPSAENARLMDIVTMVRSTAPDT
jgi:hypothetical protein